MERRVVVTHPAGSSILLIHPGSQDLHTAAGRDGDLTGLISPKISGQYGALRPGLRQVRQFILHVPPAPVAQQEEAPGSKPVECTFESCRGYPAGDAREAERLLRTQERESSTLSTGSLRQISP